MRTSPVLVQRPDLTAGHRVAALDRLPSARKTNEPSAQRADPEVARRAHLQRLDGIVHERDRILRLERVLVSRKRFVKVGNVFRPGLPI